MCVFVCRFWYIWSFILANGEYCDICYSWLVPLLIKSCCWLLKISYAFKFCLLVFFLNFLGNFTPKISIKTGASRHRRADENTRTGCGFYHTKSQAESSYGGPVREQKRNLGNPQKKLALTNKFKIAPKAQPCQHKKLKILAWACFRARMGPPSELSEH